MKYLKKIFENDLYSQVDDTELKDFCETYLAYLLDDTSFKIEVIDTEKWDSHIIWLGKTLVDRRIQAFSWDEIKDYYIPFVTILSREYDLNDKDLDQRSSSIIVNFVSGNQLFVSASGVEDWDGRLTKRPDFYTGNGIKEIGIVVKGTIKQKTNEGIKKSLVAASLGLGLMGNPQITKGSNITPISQTQTQEVLARVNFESYQPISNPDLDLVHGALGSNRLQDDFEKRVEDELKNQVNNGNKPDVANIQVRTYVQGNKIITKASCDIVQSVDGIAYTHFTTRGSIGSNYVQRHDNQINGLVSRLENHYGGIAKQVGNTIEISFKLNGNVISYRQSFFISSDGNINNNQITATDINNLRDKLNFETRDIYVDISSISVDMKNYKVSYKTGDVEIYKMSLLFDDSGNLDNRLKMIKSKNPTFKEVKRGKEGNLDWIIGVITKQVSEKMRYLKTFESVDLENDLRDFCETYLAYLLDGDFELSVIWNGHGYLGREEDDYNINLVKLNDYGATGFTWNEVKDSYIPFLHMLDKQYEIMDEGEASRNAGQWDVPCICLYNGSQNFCVSVKDVLSGEPLPGRYDDRPLLEITLQVEMKKITESVELQKDDVEHYLAYLIDEEFEVKSIIKGGGFADVKPQQAICLERKLSREEWQSILKTGLEHKSVIIGVRSEPMKVHNPSQFKPSVLLSNFKCNLLDSIEYLAQDAADKLLLSLSDQFSTTKIIMSFKVGAGHVQQYNFGDISIRLQIILID